MQEIPPPAGDSDIITRNMEESPPAAEKAEKAEETETKPFFTPPTYTMKEIHDAIPAHCFERNTLLSLCYVLRDFTFVAILMGLATQIPLLPTHSLSLGTCARMWARRIEQIQMGQQFHGSDHTFFTVGTISQLAIHAFAAS